MKKVLSIVLSIAMVLCMMPAMAFAGTTSAQADAAYSDTAGTACEGAVNVLSALGVVSGYTDGTYKPEQVVTRAEMAKLIVTALGVSDYSTATSSSYIDMGAAEWAIPVVEYATSLGIINGYGKGKFGPNDPVTYEQVATMICRALGYTTDCKEMNGTYPAVFVQKARALGILDDIEGNALGTGANRGDCAIMLYNTLELAQVYADADGVTQTKNGTDSGYYGNAAGTGYVTMMGTLNKNGYYEYGVVTDEDANGAVSTITNYIGAAAKKIYNKSGDVLALSDIKTTFITGKYYTNDNVFEANGVKYKIGNNVYKTFANPKVSDNTVNASNAVGFINNTEGSSKVLSDYNDTKVTIAAKLSGKTITEIYSINRWNIAVGAVKKVAEGDIAKIASQQSLLGIDFPLNDDKEIDTTAFILQGVDSLDQIKADNIVAVYADGTGASAKITKVTVGTEVVEGKVTLVKAATATAGPEVTIDGTTYKSSGLTGARANMIGIAVKDEVRIFLDYDGEMFTYEDLETSWNYGVILTKAAQDASYGGDYKIALFTAEGEKTTYTFKDKAAFDSLVSASNTTGAFIRYELNSAGKITDVDETSDSGAVNYKNGVIAGKKVADSCVLFIAKNGASAKKDDYAVGAVSDIDDDITHSWIFTNNKGEAVGIMVDEAATNASDIFGLVNSMKTASNDADDKVYQIAGVANGADFTDYTKDTTGTYTTGMNLKYIKKSAGEITSVVNASTSAQAIVLSDSASYWNTKGSVIAYQNGTGVDTVAGQNAYLINKVDGSILELVDNSGAKTSVTINDAIVYEPTLKSTGKFDKWVVGSVSDISTNGYVVLFQTNKKSATWDTVIYISDKQIKDCTDSTLIGGYVAPGTTETRSNAMSVTGLNVKYAYTDAASNDISKIAPEVAAKVGGSVVSVNEISAGNYTVTIEKNGVNYNYNVVVAEATYTVTVSPSSITIGKVDGYKTKTLTATVKESATGVEVQNPTIAWTSSDTSKATVGAATGIVTGVEEGSATITATYTWTKVNGTDGTDTGTATAIVDGTAIAPTDNSSTVNDLKITNGYAEAGTIYYMTSDATKTANEVIASGQTKTVDGNATQITNTAAAGDWYLVFVDNYGNKSGVIKITIS